MIVAHDGTGDFKTIQEAINSLPKDNQTPITIFIKSGVYKEKLHLEVPYVTLKGEDAKKTILTYDDYALKIHEDGRTKRQQAEEELENIEKELKEKILEINVK